MAERDDTYAPARPIPYLLGRVAAQTISLPVRNGSAGSLVAPSSGTLTITCPGASVVTSGAVSFPGDIATATLSSMIGLELGAGYTLVWALTIAGVAYTYRFDAYLCDYVPACAISVLDMYAREPELKHRIPQSQAASTRGGSGEGWQVQVDEAYYDLIQTLLDRGESPWLIRGLTGLRAWLRSRALMLCCRTLSTATDDQWDRKAGVYYAEHKAADGSLAIQRDTDPATLRTSRGPYRLAPVGRPQC
jgi:hypothetical protein